MKAVRQTTLKEQVSVTGVGVHSGLPVTLTLQPADADTGIVFVRTDADALDREARADYRCVTATEFATVLGDSAGALVSTAEHVLAALRGLGVDNATIEIDGPEVPIMDGSAGDFVTAIDQAGITTLEARRKYIEVLKPVRVTMGQASAEWRPYSRGFRVEVDIEFDHPMIGLQSFASDLDAGTFRREISRARTFGFVRDVSKMWAAGYALGASFENTLVISDTRVLNPEGLRFADEFARHKALDAIGDLSLSGAPILGAYRSKRGGHKLNSLALTTLMSDPSAWALVDAEQPARRRGHAEVAAGLIAPAYAPDVS
jgi:UDP-3-O-[3-hydroxymyristoyl] N-acetylglucosamine deacetylase